MSLLSSAVPKEKMARAVAIFLMGSTIGNAAAFLGGGFLLNRLDRADLSLPFASQMAPWQILFLMASAPGVILAILFARIREPGRSGFDKAAAGFRGSISAALLHMLDFWRAYGFLTAATSCSIILTQAQAAWVPQLFVRNFGLSPGDSAISVGLMFLVSAPTGQWVGGF